MYALIVLNSSTIRVFHKGLSKGCHAMRDVSTELGVRCEGCVRKGFRAISLLLKCVALIAHFRELPDFTKDVLTILYTHTPSPKSKPFNR